MAEKERLTKKERQERERQRRKEQEQQQTQKRQRGNLRNGLLTFVVVLAVGAVLYQALAGGTPTIDDPILISSSEAEAARDAAGCEVLTERQPLPEAYHVESSDELDADAVYTDTRPTHSGPHTTSTHPVVTSPSSQISEVSSTHNLEHGTIIAWYDPDEVDRSTQSDIGDWAELLTENGLENAPAGVGVMSSPYEDPGISSGKAIALRAWGTAMDCDEWDETVANAFVAEHYGERGIAPERALAGQFPTDIVDFEDIDEDELIDDDAAEDPDPAHDAEVEDDDEGGADD